MFLKEKIPHFGGFGERDRENSLKKSFLHWVFFIRTKYNPPFWGILTPHFGGMTCVFGVSFNTCKEINMFLKEKIPHFGGFGERDRENSLKKSFLHWVFFHSYKIYFFHLKGGN